MKNENRVILLSMILLNVLLIIILIYSRFFWNNSEVRLRSINSNLNMEMIYQNQKKNLTYQVISDDAKLKGELRIQNENDSFSNLNSIVSKPTLILRYSELNCQSCVDIIISSLLSDSSFNVNNTLLLGYYREPTYLYQFKRVNRINFPIYNIKEIGLPPDTLNMPYFFILDQNLTTHNVFIPEEGDTISIKHYLNFAAKKLINM